MHEGKIIEYIDQGKVSCTLCLQDKGNRLHLLTSLNRQVNLAPKRAVFVSSSTLEPSSPREEILAGLKQMESRRESLKQEIHVRDLWELIKDEKESFDYTYLAQLCFGEETTEDHVSALVRALFEDKTYFKMKEGRFIPLAEDKVEKIVRQRDEKAQKGKRLQRDSEWLKEVFKGDDIPQEENGEHVIEVLVDLALFGKDASRYEYGKELLARAGFSHIGKARSLLIRLGIWEEDEPVDILRLDIRRRFAGDLLRDATELNEKPIDRTGREDLRHLPVFTIDGPHTEDFDDALSVEIQGDHIQIGIHITDAAALIDAGSHLDREASLRGSSLYLPRRQIPMFPPELAHDRLSLIRGEDRPAVSLLTRFDRDGNLQDYRFVLSLINVKRQLTYDTVNEQMEMDETFSALFQICSKLQQRRVEQGALILSLPELSIRVHDDASVSIEMVSQDSPSRMMIAELMILYNWLTARFCRDNQVPVLYRSQKEPSEKLPVDETGYIYFVFRQRRKLHPLVIDVAPAPHAGLGLDAYTNVTSPIRRFFDLVIQRQVRHFLLYGTSFYNREELEKIRLRVAPNLKDIDTVKRNRIRYWILKYLQQQTGKETPAIILDVMKSKYRVILTEYLITAEMKRDTGRDFSPGKGIMVRVNKSDPWDNLLKLEYAGIMDPC